MINGVTGPGKFKFVLLSSVLEPFSALMMVFTILHLSRFTLQCLGRREAKKEISGLNGSTFHMGVVSTDAGIWWCHSVPSLHRVL